MSHYQAYLKAVGSQDPKRNSSAPVPSVARKPAVYTAMPSPNPTRPSMPSSASPSTGSLPQRSSSPAFRSARGSPANSFTRSPGPTPSSQFAAAAAENALAAHHPPKATPSSPSQPSMPQEEHKISIPDSLVSKALSHALALLQNASAYHGKRPFSALLLAPDHQSILLSHFSISHIRHAESELARLAADQFSTSYLSQCTLVSTWEPCAMCSGTIYWSGIGRVVYAASEEKLKQLTGSGNEENMTMSLPCRTVLGSGQRNIEVIGPVPYWEEQVVEECGKWWKEHGGSGSRKGSVNGVERQNGHTHAKAASIVTTWTGEESVLSSIGEDGEYKADLDIDWMR